MMQAMQGNKKNKGEGGFISFDVWRRRIRSYGEGVSSWRRDGLQSLLDDLGVQSLLQLVDLAHHGHRLLVLGVDLAAELGVLGAHALDLLAEVQLLVVGVVALPLGACGRRLAGAVVRVLARRRLGGALARVDPPQKLVEVLLAREALARVALAVGVRTVQGVLGPAVLPVHLALVP